MKEVFNFIVWQWRKWEFWQKCFIASSFFFGFALASEGPYAQYLMMIPMFVVFAFMTKWFVWDALKANFAKYKEEKDKLFDTIKESGQ